MRLVICAEQMNQVIGCSNASEILRENNTATKFLRADSIDLLVHEYQVLRSLSHPNIVKLASEKPFKMIKKLKKVGLQLELGHIDMLHFLKQSQPFRLNTPTVKNLFRSLADALNYLHTKKNLSHNDLKLENILLFFNKSEEGTQITAKLIDFGLASSSHVLTSTISNNWQNRSPNNLPPEIIEQLNYCSYKKNESSLHLEERGVDLSKGDVFQFGLTLFNALFLNNAFFCQDKRSDYQNFISDHPEDYWSQPRIQDLLQMIRVDQSGDQIEQIINLFNQLFQYNPQKRPTMEQVLNHPWFTSSY